MEPEFYVQAFRIHKGYKSIYRKQKRKQLKMAELLKLIEEANKLALLMTKIKPTTKNFIFKSILSSFVVITT